MVPIKIGSNIKVINVDEDTNEIKAHIFMDESMLVDYEKNELAMRYSAITMKYLLAEELVKPRNWNLSLGIIIVKT